MTAFVHFEEEILYETTFRNLCGRSGEATSYDAHVTCPKCRKLLGYVVPEAVPVLDLQPKELPDGSFRVAA